eukprot:XP_001697304.1 predicted protein [Chlamydomonas reinhardtii]
MIKSGGPKNLKAWVWATKLEGRLHRRPRHQRTCRNYGTAPAGITGIIELTSAFYRMYPNAALVCKKETAVKETAASTWYQQAYPMGPTQWAANNLALVGGFIPA